MIKKTLTEQQILNNTIIKLRSNGVKGAIQYLRSVHPKKKQSLLVPRNLMQIAWQMLRFDPKKSIEIAEAVIELNPALSESWVVLGLAQDHLGDRVKSRESLKTAIEKSDIIPNHLLIAANLLVRLNEGNLALEKGLEAYRKLGSPVKAASALMYIARKMADWDLVDELVGQLKSAYQADGNLDLNEIPTTHLNWCDQEEINQKVVDFWSRRSIFIPPNPLEVLVAEPIEGRKIRVGYLSSDYREHPTSRLINGLFRHHDKSRFELFMYCSGWDDGSAIRKEVCSYFDHIHSVANLSDQDAAMLIRSHKIDVLVELNGPTRANRMGLLAWRPAPVQIDYLGWPGSVGGRIVDYIVGDYYTIPKEQEKKYPENIIRLDGTYQINDYRAKRLPKFDDRSLIGLNNQQLVIGVFNAIHKVKNEVWDTWMKILVQVPEAVLWMLDPGDLPKQNIIKATVARGVDPNRIIYAPRAQQNAHLSRLQCCDITLDPWPYGGHTSTSDTLFAGVPVIALEGKNFAGRVSGGLLLSAGLPELIAKDRQEYVEKAVFYLKNPGALTELKRKISNNIKAANIFDARYKTKQFEAAYQLALERFLANKPFININIAGQRNADDVAPSQLGKSRLEEVSHVPKKKFKVAVITPYWNEPIDVIDKCISSVRNQTMECTHFIVSDGNPKDIKETNDLIHIKLPLNVNNCGATPRGLGAQIAFNMGFDLVAFLDADNTFDRQHLAEAAELFSKNDPDVVFAKRRIYFPDGKKLTKNDPQDASGAHVDTNCIVLSKRVAYLAKVFAMWPHEFGTGEDRLFLRIVKALKLKTMNIPIPTVNYWTNWAIHYQLENKKPEVPLRKPTRKASLHFDPKRMYHATGYFLSLPAAPEATIAEDSLPSKPHLWVAMYVVKEEEAEAINQSITQITKKKQVSGVVVIGFIDRPIGLLESYYYLKVPSAAFNQVNALGYASCLAFQYGADIVLIGAHPSQSYLQINEKQPEANVLIDLTLEAKGLGMIKEFENDFVLSLLVTKQASFMAYFLAQLPKGLSEFALITILVKLGKGYKEKVIFISGKNKLAQLKANLSDSVLASEIAGAVENIKQAMGVDISRFD